MFESLKDQLIELEKLSINISDLIRDNKYENIVFFLATRMYWCFV